MSQLVNFSRVVKKYFSSNAESNKFQFSNSAETAPDHLFIHIDGKKIAVNFDVNGRDENYKNFLQFVANTNIEEEVQKAKLFAVQSFGAVLNNGFMYTYKTNVDISPREFFLKLSLLNIVFSNNDIVYNFDTDDMFDGRLLAIKNHCYTNDYSADLIVIS